MLCMLIGILQCILLAGQIAPRGSGAGAAIGTELAKASVEGGWHWAVLIGGPIVLLLLGIGVYKLRQMIKGE